MINRQRFIEVFKKFGNDSVREFSRTLDLSEDNVGNYINGTTKNIPFAVFEKVKKTYPEISSDWLLVGEGEMLKGDTINSFTDNENSANTIQHRSKKNYKDIKAKSLNIESSLQDSQNEYNHSSDYILKLEEEVKKLKIENELMRSLLGKAH